MNSSILVVANQVAGFIVLVDLVDRFLLHFDGKGFSFLRWAPLNINKSFGIVVICKLRDGWVGGRRRFKVHCE